MTYDYSKLAGRITEVYGTQYNFAVAMGLSEHSISAKLNGKTSWRDRDIEKAINVLGVSAEEIPKYFFKQKVHA
ncbi:DUF739 family protein [Lacticaseibacillus saniviri]